MTTKQSERHSAEHSAEPGSQRRLATAARRVAGASRTAVAGAANLIARVPGTMQATQAGARDTTSALQTLPNSTLRWLAAGSVGLGAGFYLAGAPRLASAAGVAPALLMGAAIALRPTERGHEDGNGTDRGAKS